MVVTFLVAKLLLNITCVYQISLALSNSSLVYITSILIASWTWPAQRFSFGRWKLIGFALTTLCGWLKKFVPIFHPIRSKTKTDNGSLAHVFPRFASATWNYLEVWLPGSLYCICPLWLASVILFGFGFTTLNWKPLKNRRINGRTFYDAVLKTTLFILQRRSRGDVHIVLRPLCSTPTIIQDNRSWIFSVPSQSLDISTSFPSQLWAGTRICRPSHLIILRYERSRVWRVSILQLLLVAIQICI